MRNVAFVRWSRDWIGHPPQEFMHRTQQMGVHGIPVVLLKLFVITCFGVNRNKDGLGFLSLKPLLVYGNNFP